MAATVRTDIYRPSAPDFDPAEFDLVGVFDLNPEEGTPPGIRGEIIRREIDAGYRFAGVHPTGQCDHCGARIRYEAILRHLPTRKLITVGETCLDNRFAFGTAEDFAALRKEAARKAEITRERHRLGQIRLEAEEWLAVNDPELRTLLDRSEGSITAENGFLSDLARKLFQYGYLTDRQAEAAVRAIVRDREHRERHEQREREEQARKPAPTGRVLVEGTVGATWEQHGDYGLSWKFRVTTDDGWVAISTIPSALFAQLDALLGFNAGHEQLRGRRVRFTATLTPTQDGDPTTAWAKRPTRAELVVPV